MKYIPKYRNRLFFKSLFSLLLVVVQCQTTNAQILGGANPSRKSKVLPKAYAGIKFGGNFSYLSGDTWSNGIKSNLLGGAFAGFKGAGFGVQVEALFAQSEYTTGNGFFDLYHKYYNQLGDSLKQGTFRVNQLALPVMLQFRVAHLFWIQTGAQFSGVVSVRDFNHLVNDSKNLFKTGNVSGLLGASIHLGNADIGARALIDFQNFNNLSSTDVWRQYTLQLHVGVTIF